MFRHPRYLCHPRENGDPVVSVCAYMIFLCGDDQIGVQDFIDNLIPFFSAECLGQVDDWGVCGFNDDVSVFKQAGV